MFFKNWIEESPTKYENNEVVRTNQWLAIMILMIFPVLNVLVLLYWALKGKEDIYPASMVNFARAALIIMLVAAVVFILDFFFYRWTMT